MISLPDNHKIVSASMIIRSKVVPLMEKPQGNTGQPRCHFYEYKSGKFRIALRLDWGDLDQDGNPTLDADIYKDGIEYLSGHKQWHNTLKTFENGEFVYVWKPKIDELHALSPEIKFKLQTTNTRTITGVASIAPPDNTVRISKKQIKQSQKILEEITQKEK